MKLNRKNILVPIDFNEISLKSIDYAIDLCNQVDGQLFLLHVINTSNSFFNVFLSITEIDNIKQKAIERIESLIEQKQIKLKSKISYSVEEGKTYRIINKFATELNARYIVMADNHEDEPEKILGSTMAHVVTEAKCPVLIPRKDRRFNPKNIVVPVDLYKESRLQLFNSISFGLNYNSTIHLVSVISGGVNPLRSRIYSKLKKMNKTIKENGISSSIKLFKKCKDNPYLKVLDYAKEVDADLILILTHQETSYDNYIGAFAHHIINESSVPVLSISVAAAKESSEVQSFMKAIYDPFGILVK